MDDGLHLHRLQHHERVAGRHEVADLDRHAHDDAGCGSADSSAVVPSDAVGDPVDLDEVGAGLLGREHAVRALADRQAPPVAARVCHRDVDHAAVHLDAVGLRPAAQHVQLVRRPEVAEGDKVPDVGADLRAAAGGGGQELAQLVGRVDLIGMDRHVAEGDLGVGRRVVLVALDEVVDPAHVHSAGLKVGMADDPLQERAIARAAPYEHRGP